MATSLALAAAWLQATAPTARAADPEAVVTTSAALVPGVHSPGATVPTAAGTVAFDGTSGPSMRAGIAASGTLWFGDRDRLVGRWGVWRDQRWCDTCASGSGPVGVGPDLLGSTDLDTSFVHEEPLGDAGALWLSGLLTLPASRDALVCNPLVAAPGAGASFRLRMGEGLVAVGVSARRPIYTHGAAPVGACDTGPVPAVATLAGAADARPWAGTRWGAANPVLSATGSLQLLELEDFLGGVNDHLTTSAALGLAAVREGAASAVAVPTLAGDAVIPAAHEPVRLAVPWSISAGWMVHRTTSLSASLSNSLPAVLADPGGTLRAQPASTQIGVALSTTLSAKEVP